MDRWRNVFLGVLAHELRGPLDSFLLSARLLAMLPEASPVSAHVTRVQRGSDSMAP